MHYGLGIENTPIGEKAAPRSFVPIGCHVTADAFAGSKINTYYCMSAGRSYHRDSGSTCHAANCKQMNE
jgi:hypothetical protein